MTTKADYVRSQGQTRKHHCHWPGCDKQVPPAMWGCKAHWFTLPAGLRAKVWRTYVPGQEVNGTPSAAYLTVADEVQRWCREYIASQAHGVRELPAERALREQEARWEAKFAADANGVDTKESGDGT